MEGHGRGGDGGEGVTMDPTKFGRKLTPMVQLSTTYFRKSVIFCLRS